jgi:hypothetical protein
MLQEIYILNNNSMREKYNSLTKKNNIIILTTKLLFPNYLATMLLAYATFRES